MDDKDFTGSTMLERMQAAEAQAKAEAEAQRQAAEADTARTGKAQKGAPENK